MSEKKKPGRFTLQFNLEDPQQRTVSCLLEQQGRHKAQFITSAVLLYTQNPMPKDQGSSRPAVTEEALERMLLAILARNPQFNIPVPAGHSKETAGPSQDAPVSVEKDKPMAEDAVMAIAETLAAFQSE